MTFIRPDKASLINKILIALVIPIFGGVISLILVYNQVVSVSHDIGKLKKDIETSQAEAAELKEKVFAFYGSENVENIVDSLGLVQEKNPEYFTIREKWAFASQQ